MSETTRKEILDLLARGKISVDEAVVLLSEVRDQEQGVDRELSPDDAPVHKVDTLTDDAEKIVIIEELETAVLKEKQPPVESGKAVKDGHSPNWLRVRVRNLDTGKNKVTVNVPFGMVKFGLNIASHFSPELKDFDLRELNSFMAGAETGILVDVEDDESNEHVQVFLE